MKEHGGSEGMVLSFFISALDGEEWQNHAPIDLFSGIKPGAH
jgi:hypothetical protein